MTKKIHQFLRHWIIGERIFPGSTSVQVLSPTGKNLVDDLAESRNCGFALAFDRLAKSPAFNFNAYSSSNCISGFPARCCLGLVVQVRDQFIPAMRNSDP